MDNEWKWQEKLDDEAFRKKTGNKKLQKSTISKGTDLSGLRVMPVRKVWGQPSSSRTIDERKAPIVHRGSHPNSRKSTQILSLRYWR